MGRAESPTEREEIMISMRRVFSILVVVVLISIAGVTPTMAQVPGGSRSGEPLASSIRGAERPDWGGSDRILYAVGFSEFSPGDSSVTYSTSQRGRYSTVPYGFFHATPHILSGVLLTYLELDYCDSGAGDDVTLILLECSFLGDDCTQMATLDSGTSPTGCDFVSADLTPVNYTTNNNSRRLVLSATTFSGTSANVIVGAYIGYKLQVSPAPGSATFLDVPAGHPFFRFVEALSRSGITAGCGGGNYCPDQPLTRGQMAVFLSVALGLHFPN